MLRLSVQRAARIVFATGLASMTMACAAIDNVDSRADTMNDGVARFRNQAVLRNIIRASNYEPLNFGAISGITGHNTVLLGLPGVSWNAPSRAPNEAVGSTTAGYNFSNDFNFNEIDDPATYVALLTPLDAATIANLWYVQQGVTPPDLSLLMFIHHISVRANTKNSKNQNTPGELLRTYYGGQVVDPKGEVLLAYTYLVVEGLTFRVERGSIPGQQKRPRVQICFDPDSIPNRDKNPILSIRRHGLPKLPPPKEKMLEGKGNCADPKTWLPAVSSDTATTTSEAYNCVSSVCTSSKKAKAAARPEAFYSVYDSFDNVWIELYPRSTASIYDLLGTLAREQEPVRLMGPGLGEDPYILHINRDRSLDCFVETFDRGEYCVPQNANNTKRIFSILHQLAALFSSSASATPNTSTVRVTP